MMIQPTRPRPVAVISTGASGPKRVPSCVASWARTITTPFAALWRVTFTVRCSPGSRVTSSDDSTQIRLGELLVKFTFTVTLTGNGLVIVTGNSFFSDPITNWLETLSLTFVASSFSLGVALTNAIASASELKPLLKERAAIAAFRALRSVPVTSSRSWDESNIPCIWDRSLGHGVARVVVSA